MRKLLAGMIIFLSACSSSGSSSTTNWGALITGNDIDTRIAVMNQMGVKYARTSTTIVGYTGKLGDVEKLQAAGFKVLLNVSYEPQGGTPRKFPTDMTAYRASLAQIFSKYKPEIVVIENEPTNQLYYVDDMANYLTELKNAVDVGHQYGLKVADGALHVEALDALIHNQLSNPIVQRQQELLKGYVTLNLDYVNVHMAVGESGLGDDSGFPAGLLQEVSKYIVDQTKHHVIANEISFHNPSTNLLGSMIAELQATNVVSGEFSYAIAYSGDDDPYGALPLNVSDALNDLGQAYRNTIQ